MGLFGGERRSWREGLFCSDAVALALPLLSEGPKLATSVPGAGFGEVGDVGEVLREREAKERREARMPLLLSLSLSLSLWRSRTARWLLFLVSRGALWSEMARLVPILARPRAFSGLLLILRSRRRLSRRLLRDGLPVGLMFSALAVV